MSTLYELRSKLLCVALLLLPCQAIGQASGRDYPNRPITVIIPFAPGATDLMARIYTQEVSRTTGWNFTYDYKPGAAGRVGTAAAARSAPDGYSMHGNSATIAYGHLMKSKLTYDWRKDFIPLFQMNRTPSILLVNPGLPVNSVADYISYGKANPGKILNDFYKENAQSQHRSTLAPRDLCGPYAALGRPVSQGWIPC